MATKAKRRNQIRIKIPLLDWRHGQNLHLRMDQCIKGSGWVKVVMDLEHSYGLMEPNMKGIG